MKRVISTVLRSILSSLLTVGFLVIAFLILRSYLSGVFSPPVATPVTSPSPSTTTVITSTLSYGDALKTYAEVATCAIHASERALNTIKWLVGAQFALFTLAAGVAAYLYKTAREAEEKARSAEVAAQIASEAAASARSQLDALSDRYMRLHDLYEELKDQYEEQREKILSLDAEMQMFSWIKWKELGDITGWYELREDAWYGEGLTPSVRLAVERELERMRHTVEEEEYKQQLQALLRPHPGE